MIISICGVAGVGKTTISKKLAEKLSFEHIDITEFIVKNKLYEEYDEANQTYIVDENKVIEKIMGYINQNKDKNFIIDGNFSHLFPSDIYIIIKTDPNILYKRLSERGYPYHKIFENTWAMNLEVLEDELEEMGREYYIFYNNKEEDIEKIVEEIINIVLRKLRK